MPNYPGTGQTGPLLYQNRQGIFWASETPAIGTASRAFQLGHCKGNGWQGSMSVDALFAGNSGVYQVDVEVADFDQDSAYVVMYSLGGTNSTTNAQNATRLALSNFVGQFIRLRMVARANSVACTALVSRA